ncbi:MAG: type II toxin-antitoxin system prevent-host-death family antitoxin [Treponema sp.]|nr:type II toxin-antitoxin system prevent-host-death family antitoxin [Treponema sp.]
MVVTATQFKASIGHYLDTVAENKPVYITKNGRLIAKLSDPAEDKMSILNALVGIIPKNHMSLDDIKRERLARHAPWIMDPKYDNPPVKEEKV